MKFSAVGFTMLLTILCSGCDQKVQTQTLNSNPANEQTSEVSTPDSVSSEVPSVESDGIVFGDKFPEVLAVEAKPIGDMNWRFNVTLSSPYDSRQRYADAWRVLDGDGRELGIRVLGHDHASEQPFTRSQTGRIPDEITTVFVEGRDQANGWSGQRFEMTLSGLKPRN